jgi:CBS domain-containing protein
MKPAREEFEMSTTVEPYRHHYVGPEFQHARVHDVMRVGVVNCQPETSLRDVARIMVGYRIHSVLVGDAGSGESPWGILTDLDLATAGTSDITELTAGDVASPELVTVRTNESLAGAAKLMSDRKCSHLLAVQPDTGRPVGVISALGIAAVIAAGRG